MKPGADAVGVYFYFENGNKSVENLLREYPESYKRNFSRRYFLECMARGAFSLSEYEDVGYIVNSGENLGFSFHADGEKMYLMPCSAKLEN